jgi:hypothetical protein
MDRTGQWRDMATRLACALEAVLDVDWDDQPDERKIREAELALKARLALRDKEES